MTLKLTSTKMRRLHVDLVDAAAWYYEEPLGLVVVTEVRDENGYPTTVQFRITWEQVRASLKRLESSP